MTTWSSSTMAREIAGSGRDSVVSGDTPSVTFRCIIYGLQANAVIATVWGYLVGPARTT